MHTLMFVLRQGGLVCFFLLLCVTAPAQFTLDREPPGPSSRRTGLVITEIMYNPRPVPGMSTNLTLEFIELFNSKPWDEDVSGFAIAGAVHYTIPAHTVLRAGAYLVVARVPELMKTKYGITNVLGPWDGALTNRLPVEGGLVQLRNRQGAVLLSIDYMDSPPWPEAADGTGHSLSLARPSYGEDDPRAWAESDRVGGSPGGPDPLTPDPLAVVCINEWQNHSDPVDWVELYNHSNSEVDISGAYLSDDPATNKFRIPDGTILPPRGFRSYTQTQLGFELFAGGETVFFVNLNQTRVIDVIDFRGQSNNISSGRWPDGGPIQYGLARRTPGEPNSEPMRYAIVINELMYNPISGSADDEYVEIYNRSARAVDLSAWEFIVGISYLFPSNTPPMPAGAHWVLAKNPTNLFRIYSNLNTNNTFGPYGGTLANGGERIVLAAADYDRVDGPGMSIIERLPVPVCDLTYGDGGKWGDWSDGQGSSLELIDPEADPHHPANWADSNDTGESQWTAIEYNGPLGETLGTNVNDSLIICLQGLGECLVDEVEVRADGGPNLVANGGFEAGLEGWFLQGSHDFSTVESEGFAAGRSLHIRAASRGDNQSNRILSMPFVRPIPLTVREVSIRAKVRWLRGHPELLLRLHGSATEAYGRMALPSRLGTPGAPNSRRIANAGPAIYEMRHAPLLPADGEAVVVTARATDFHGLAALTLRYRLDPAPEYSEVPMRDEGTDGDAIAGDGIYSAVIPGQSGGAIVAFYVEGRDAQNAAGTFPHPLLPPPGLPRCWPNDAVARECVVRWGEQQPAGDFAAYHLWVTAVNSNRWHSRDTQNNTPMDGTFVYNNTRVMYNALPLYSGSPWHRTNAITGPAGPHRVDYEMNFPDDDPLLGSTDFVLNNPGNPNLLTISDLSGLAEQMVYQIFEGMGLPHNHRRYIHFFVNGSRRSKAYERAGDFIFEDSQQPNGDVIAEWFPESAGGQLFKVEDWFEFEPNGFDIAANNDADLTRRTTMLDGQPTFVPAPYRFMFRKRSVSVGASANDYSDIYALVDAVSPAEDPDSERIDPERFGRVADWEQWMRFFAIQRAVGNWDSYGWQRGKNDYLYRPAGGGFNHLPWDIDYSLGLGEPATAPLFESNDPRVSAMFRTPEIVRAYWRAFEELVQGPFSNDYLDPFIDTRAAALLANQVDIDLEAVAAIKRYIAERRTFLLEQIATVSVPFVLEGPADFETTNNLVVIRGAAPVTIKSVTLNGGAYPLTWTSATEFELRVVLQPGTNEIVLQGFDRLGVVLAEAVQTLRATYTGPVVEPAGALMISEIMYDPAASGGQFVEIINRSPMNFDLSGWRLEGAGLTFPPGSIVTNGQTIVLARDEGAFRSAYARIPVFARLGADLSSVRAQTLALVRGGTTGREVIDAVRYEPRQPWPAPVAGASLQLIDVAQDNSRPCNWAVDTNVLATPGAPNSTAAALAPFDPLWLNEVQISSFNGLVDNIGEPAPWVELYNAGTAPVSLAGYFLANSCTSNLTQWPLPEDMVLAPGEHRVIWADGEWDQTDDHNLHAPFRLEIGGELSLVRLAGGGSQVVDYLRWSSLGPNLTYGSSPEGQPVFRALLRNPTPADTNTFRAWPIVINEFLARNTTAGRDPADSDYEDWFELYNTGLDPVDLGGFYLTDNTANPMKFMVPTNGQYQIPPGGFLLVWADDEPNQNNRTRSDLHVNFQLSGSAGDIALMAPDGQTTVDLVSYGPQTNNISEGCYVDGASTRYSMPRSTPKGPNSIPGYNTAPQFPPLADAMVLAGETITITIRATDPDGDLLTYSIDSAPYDSRVYFSGYYRWYVPTNQPAGTYPVTLRVTDNGTPPLSQVATFYLTVPSSADPVTPDLLGPGIQFIRSTAGQATFTIATTPGRTYRVLYKDDLDAPAWTQLGPDFVAANRTASLTDELTVPQRFYQVLQLP